MRTSETSAEREIMRYINAGYSFKFAVNHAKSMSLHRNDPAVDRAAEKIQKQL